MPDLRLECRELNPGPLPRYIWMGTGITLFTGTLCLLLAASTGQREWVRMFVQYPGALFLDVCSVAQLVLCWLVWRHFGEAEPLRAAWRFFTMAAAGRVIGNIFLETPTAGGLGDRGAMAVNTMGELLSGPVSLVALACGLCVVLRVYKRYGMINRTWLRDAALFIFVIGFTTCQSIELLHWMKNPGQPAMFSRLLNWTADPLLVLLLLEAVLLRRAVLAMRHGLIARCWAAYLTAICATALGTVATWTQAPGQTGWSSDFFITILWYAAAAAFTLAPAYQLVALHNARQGAALIQQALHSPGRS